MQATRGAFDPITSRSLLNPLLSPGPAKDVLRAYHGAGPARLCSGRRPNPPGRCALDEFQLLVQHCVVRIGLLTQNARLRQALCRHVSKYRDLYCILDSFCRLVLYAKKQSIR